MSKVILEARATILTRSQSGSQSDELVWEAKAEDLITENRYHRSDKPDVTYSLTEKRTWSLEKSQGHP